MSQVPQGVDLPQDYESTVTYLPNGPRQPAPTNPYSSLVDMLLGRMNDAQNNAMLQVPKREEQIADSQQQMQAFGQTAQGYPTMKNDYGLGSQGTPTQAAPPAPSSSHGFNPWSLQGEALSR